ncbi:hypothetical protein BH10BAC5_BH10BAC5_02300 [soil metagenome]
MKNRILFSILFFTAISFNMLYSQEKTEITPESYAEGSTNNFEVLIAYSNIQPGKESKMKVYVSDFKTNVPVDNANIDITISEIDDSKVKIIPTQEAGIYELSVSFPEIKKYNFLIGIAKNETSDLIPINEVDIGAKPVTEPAPVKKSILATILSLLPYMLGGILLIGIIAVVFYRLGTLRNRNRITETTSVKAKKEGYEKNS